ALGIVRQDEPDHVAGAPAVELRLLGRRDDVVRRREDGADVAAAGGVVAQGGERRDDGHQCAPSAARSASSAIAPARSTRIASPSTAATVEAPAGSAPPSR